MRNDLGRIIEKDWLPLKGFSYGPFKNSRASAFLSAGVLMCQFAPETNQINLKQELIKNQDVIQNLEVHTVRFIEFHTTLRNFLGMLPKGNMPSTEFLTEFLYSE